MKRRSLLPERSMVASTFATTVVIALGFLLCLGIIITNQGDYRHLIGLVGTFFCLGLLLNSLRKKDDDAVSDLEFQQRQQQMHTETHQYKLKRSRVRKGRYGTNKPPTAEQVRELKRNAGLLDDE